MSQTPSSEKSPVYTPSSISFPDALRGGVICLNLKSDTKAGIIEEMVDLLVAAGKVEDRGMALAGVREREKKMSTGMQFGVALPHGKIETTRDFVVAVALKKEGVNFQSLDGKPARIFVMTLSPVTITGPHIRFLAEISRLLTSASTRDRLLAAETVDEVIRILTE